MMTRRIIDVDVDGDDNGDNDIMVIMMVMMMVIMVIMLVMLTSCFGTKYFRDSEHTCTGQPQGPHSVTVPRIRK